MPFNIINESSLYRSPLRLLEALEGEAKKSWDLGDVHAKRNQAYNDELAQDKDAYKRGFESGNSHQSSSSIANTIPKISQPAALSSPSATSSSNDWLKVSEPPPIAPNLKISTTPRQTSTYKPRNPNKPLPELIPFDRSPISGQPDDMHPVGQGFADEVLGNPAYNIFKSIKRDDILKGPRAEMEKKGYQIGEYINAGAAGAVFEGPDEPDGMPTVFKFDNGPYEAKLADAIINTGLSGRNGLSILPRFINTEQTSGKMPGSRLPLFLIHREDIASLTNKEDKLPSIERSFLHDFGRDVINTISEDTEISLDKESNASNNQSEKESDWLNVPDLPPIGGSLTREKALKRFDRGARKFHQRALEVGGKVAEQWPRMVKEIRTLIEHGIIPCDMHGGNWGIRLNNGDIVMRDVGCNAVLLK
jgi:hypothetical protein